MNVMIICSSKEDINENYKEQAKYVSSHLANMDFSLVFGGASTSMMGICYDEFVKQEKEVLAFTTSKYVEDLKCLTDAKHYVRENTFELKKSMFQNSDLIVALPGGFGTLSEVLSFVEENRSNDQDVPIVVYDENNFYSKLFELFSKMNNEKFITENIQDYITIINNREDFKKYINDFMGKRKVR